MHTTVYELSSKGKRVTYTLPLVRGGRRAPGWVARRQMGRSAHWAQRLSVHDGFLHCTPHRSCFFVCAPPGLKCWTCREVLSCGLVWMTKKVIFQTHPSVWYLSKTLSGTLDEGSFKQCPVSQSSEAASRICPHGVSVMVIDAFTVIQMKTAFCTADIIVSWGRYLVKWYWIKISKNWLFIYLIFSEFIFKRVNEVYHSSLFFKDFIYLFLDAGKGRRHRERNINVWLPVERPLLGTWPTTQACALTGKQTGAPLVHRLVLNPLSHTSQDYHSLLFLLLVCANKGRQDVLTSKKLIHSRRLICSRVRGW